MLLTYYQLSIFDSQAAENRRSRDETRRWPASSSEGGRQKSSVFQRLYTCVFCEMIAITIKYCINCLWNFVVLTSTAKCSHKWKFMIAIFGCSRVCAHGGWYEQFKIIKNESLVHTAHTAYCLRWTINKQHVVVREKVRQTVTHLFMIWDARQ